jgi:hypothetical protein
VKKVAIFFVVVPVMIAPRPGVHETASSSPVVLSSILPGGLPRSAK